MKKQNAQSDLFKSLFPVVVIVLSIVAAWLLYKFWLGSPVNFEGGELNPNIDVHKAHPINALGTMYLGGPIVPLLMSLVLILFTFSIERGISLAAAAGKGGQNRFIIRIQSLLKDDNVEDALRLCEQQNGTLANVVQAGLNRYRELQSDTRLDKDQKIASMQKELEEASALELPGLSRNLVILSTIASIAVLVGLIGTVLGMIKAFSALANAGAPDATALAIGISEALINTAFGVSGSAVAIVLFNFFTTRVDSFTHKIDEACFSITQSFAASIKK